MANKTGGAGSGSGGHQQKKQQYNKKRTSSSPSSWKNNNKKFKSSSSGSGTGQKQQQSGQYTPRVRRHAEIVEEGKRLWNLLRQKTNTPEQQRDYVDKLIPLILGKSHQIAMQHDASRIVQAAIQFGNTDERKMILRELCQPSDHQPQSNSASKKANKQPESNLIELCKSQYAHFVVLKIVKYCCSDDQECVDLILKSIKGHVPKLAVHAFGSRVVESIFASLPSKRTRHLKREFYGPHLSLFDDEEEEDDNEEEDGGGVVGTKTTSTVSTSKIPTLATNLQKLPDKRDVTMDYVRSIISKCLSKKNMLSVVCGYAYFQDLLNEYMDVLVELQQTNEIRNTYANSALADHSLHLLSSRNGTAVVCKLIAYGTAKDRKRIIKSLKGYARSGLHHHDAYLAILRLIQLTDDTVSIQKNILHELILTADSDKTEGKKKKTAPKGDGGDDSKPKPSSPLLGLALSETASKLFLMLLVGFDDDDSEVATKNKKKNTKKKNSGSSTPKTKFLDPYEISVLSPTNPTVISDEDGTKTIIRTSKKDSTTRRMELLKYLRQPLIELCESHADELLRSRPGAVVLKEVYRTCTFGGSSSPSSVVVNSVIDACIASLRSKDGNDDDDKSPTPLPMLLEDRDGHLAVKNLILVDAARDNNKSDDDDSDDEGSSSSSSDDGEGEGTFSFELYDRLKTEFGGCGLLKLAGSNRGAFILTALCQVPYMRSQVLSTDDNDDSLGHSKAIDTLHRHVKENKKDGKSYAGYEALLNEIAK